MNATQEVAVTLSPQLFEHLRREAAALGIPLQWLVASLVADTFEDEPVVFDSALAS